MEIREKLHEEWSEKYIESTGWKHILHLAQRSGKTYCTFRILKKLDLLNKDIIISYPDNKIKEEWIKMFEFYKVAYNHIVFTNVSSLKKHLTNKYDVYIIDEINDMSENEMDYCREIIDNSVYVIGLSGTISAAKEYYIKDILNIDILIRYTIEEAIKDGLISDYQIDIYQVPLDNKILEKNKAGKMITEKKKFDNYTFVIEKMKKEKANFMFLALNRNRILQDSIAKKELIRLLLSQLGDKRVLVFTGLTKAADSLGIASFHSKSKESTVFEDFKEGKINHLAVANMGRSGATYTDLDYVIMSNLTYNSENTEQTVSRAMVLDYKDKTAKIIIVSTNEPIEIKKIRETLSGIDNSKIRWIKNVTN